MSLMRAEEVWGRHAILSSKLLFLCAGIGIGVVLADQWNDVPGLHAAAGNNDHLQYNVIPELKHELQEQTASDCP